MKLEIEIILAVLAVLYTGHQYVQRRIWQRRWQDCLAQAKEIVAGVKAQYPNCDGVVCALTIASTPGTIYQQSSAYRDLPFEDLMDLLDRVDPMDTPAFTMSRRGQELGSTQFWTEVDSWQTPYGAVGFADAYPMQASEIRDNTLNRRKVGNQGQAFREGFGTGWIAEQVPKFPGTGKGINKRGAADALIYLRQDIEVAITSFDQVATADTGAQDGSGGSLMSGIRKLVDKNNQYANENAAIVGGPSDLHFAPVNACVAEGTALADGFSLEWVENALLALRQSTNRKRTYLQLAGLGLRKAFTGLVKPGGLIGPGANAVPGQVYVYTQEIKDEKLGRSIDVVYSDYGTLMVKETDFIGDTTTDSNGNAQPTRNLRVAYNRPNYGLTLDTEMLELRFGVNFQKGNLPDDGGTIRKYLRTYAGLLCTNPVYFGFQAWT